MFLFHVVMPAYGPYRLRKPSGPTPVRGCARNMANATDHSLPRSTASAFTEIVASIGMGMLAVGGAVLCVDADACATWARTGALPTPLFPEHQITFSLTMSHCK